MKTFAKKDNRFSSSSLHRNISARSVPVAYLRAQQASIHQIVQPSIKTGQPNDRFEQEADSVADRVLSNQSVSDITPISEGSMSRASLALQKQSESEAEIKDPALQQQPQEEEQPLQAKLLQRQSEEEEEPVQAMQNNGQGRQISTANETGIKSLKGGGQPLDPVTSQFFESRFGRDFSQVRVHQGGQAADLSRSINARAFTMGNNIAFAAGEYQPHSSEGKRLLGHELTHVVQQKGHESGIQRKVTHELENDPLTAPPMACSIANSSPAGYSLDINFGINSSVLSAGSIGAIENFVNNWHFSGGTEHIRVDGYASIDGGPDINWPLSCARAHSLAYELMMPSRGVPGIPSGSISVFAQGETDQFSSSLGPNRLAQAHIPFAPVSNLLNIPDRRYSSLRKYVYGRGDATKLYGLALAPNLVPASGFTQTNSSFTDYSKQWTDGLGITRLKALGGDCGQYARALIRETGRTPDSYSTSRPGIGLAPANDLRPGEAYYISPGGTGAGAVAENVLSPWNNRQTVRKELTRFHVATVVAKDDTTVVTSEVNAAFPGHVRPWFSMYQGNAGFYSTYRKEYRKGGVNPGLWRM